MGYLELIFLAIIIFWIFYITLWLVLDCNVTLWYKERFGISVSSLRGQIIWITGASSGIGRALALNLAKNRVKLVLSARRHEQLEEVRKQCLEAANGLLADKDVLVLPMDMLKTERHEECFQTVLNHFGHLDVLVNNAGRSQRANWEDIDVQVDRDLFELDVFSVMHLSRIVVRYFLQQAGARGHIVATSSVAGIITAVPFSATYCAAKHALNSYLRSLRLEHPTLDITLFAPGPIATDFLEEAFTDKPNSKVGQSTKDQKRMTAQRCAHLFAVSIANKLNLTWAALFPVNFLTYAAQNAIFSKLLLNIMGRKTMSKIREGKI